jgi:hypothetical protein
MVERATTPVVEARLTGTGMRWERTPVKPLLAGRTGVCHERWQETWHTACQARRLAQSHHRRDRALPRRQARQDVDPPVLPPPPLPLAPRVPPEPPAMSAGTSRPSRDTHACVHKGASHPLPFCLLTGPEFLAYNEMCGYPHFYNKQERGRVYGNLRSHHEGVRRLLS